MSSTVFNSGTIIASSWLNDVNDAVYNGDFPTPLAAAGIQYNEGGTGAVTTTVQAKLQQYISVKDFGATGNGTTDDTAAIQAALNTGNSTIYFPSGTYLISSTISPKTNQVLQGEHATITTTNSNYITAITILNAPNVIIQNLIIDGNASNNAFDTGILVQDSYNVLIQGCTIKNIGNVSPEHGFGIQTKGTTDGPATSTNGVLNLKVLGNSFYNIKGDGNNAGDFIYLRDCADVLIESNYMDTCARMGISVVDYAVKIDIVGNNIKNVYLSGIDIEPNTDGDNGYVSISSNIIRNYGCKPAGYVGTQYNGIDVHEGTTKVLIDGNMIIAENSQAVAGVYAINNSDQIVISNNSILCDGYGANGILLYAGSGAVDLVITGNLISGFTSRGIDCYNNGRFVINSNWIYSTAGTVGINANAGVDIQVNGNIVRMTYASGTYGIYVAQGSQMNVSNNSVEVAAGVGLYMYASGTTTCHLAVVVGNSASNTGTGANGIEVLTAGSGVINNLSYSSNSTYNFTVPQIVSNTGSGITGACYFSGSGSPNSVLTAPLGSIYTNQSGGSGTTLYVKESGAGTTNTGWVGK